MADHSSRIPLIKADLPTLEALESSFREILGSGRVTNFGPYLTRFEQDISDYVGAEAVCLSSGTAGLILTMQGLEIPAGSRVAIPSFSFVATAQAVLYAGCVPVFVDVGADGNVDLEDFGRVMRDVPEVRAAVLVHMYGLPVPADDVARVTAVPVIYDAAHAFGSARGDRPVGSSGAAEVFSTSVTKVMTSVEGGVVTTRDAALADRLRRMRNYGIHSQYNARYPGLNAKMSEMHALVGLANLARLDELIAARTRRAAFYAAAVAAHAESRVMLAPSGVTSTYKDFTVTVPAALRPHRDAIIADLAQAGIETRAYFHPPIHEQDYFRRYADRALPMTEDLSRRVITLPFSSSITEADMTRVAEALGAAERRAAGAVTEGALS